MDGTLTDTLTFDLFENGTRQQWRQINDLLPSRTLVVHQSVAGLDCDRAEKTKKIGGSGVLEAKQDALPPTADTTPERFKDIGWRITMLTRKDEALVAAEKGPQVARFVTRFGAGGEELEGFAVLSNDFVEDESEDSRALTARSQTLRDHTEEVVRCVTDIVERLGLDAELAQALKTAAQYHDDGKAAEVWQHAAGAEPEGGPWAKTNGRKAQWNRLQGYRHEFGSLVELEERNDLPEATRDIILHLVAAHHGRARPLLSHKGYDNLPPSATAAIAGDAALRFARLQQQYGSWKLAWLETLLRAADQKASRTDWVPIHG